MIEIAFDSSPNVQAQAHPLAERLRLQPQRCDFYQPPNCKVRRLLPAAIC
jgi:hypothetical protein